MTVARIYLIGAGPGDPALLTGRHLPAGYVFVAAQPDGSQGFPDCLTRHRLIQRRDQLAPGFQCLVRRYRTAFEPKRYRLSAPGCIENRYLPLIENDAHPPIDHLDAKRGAGRNYELAADPNAKRTEWILGDIELSAA